MMTDLTTVGVRTKGGNEEGDISEVRSVELTSW